jgi:glycine/serine hydroxymethyltransferase
MHIIAAKAVAFGEALQDEFFTYALQLQKMLKQWQKPLKEVRHHFRRYRQPHDD